MLGDPRFFDGRGPFTLAAVAAAAGARLPEGIAGEAIVRRPATLDAAGPDAVSFLENARYADALAASRAGACLVRAADAPKVPPGMVALVCAQPYLAWARVLALFFPEPRMAEGGIDATASVHPSALLGAGVRIAAGAVVSARAVIGRGSVVGENAVIGEGVVLGSGCRIGALASLSHAILGDRVVIGPGARIGHAGFGFAPGPAGFEPVPQLGRVLIGDDADLGANTTVDRGSGQDTIVGAGTRIDNLVQIGHNVRLGRRCVIVAQAGVSGSAYIGSPAQPARQMWRTIAALNRLARVPSRGAPGGGAERD
ncbi:MAG: UDP-3-O-(3-hydroxymyristoyl)glucosamine N-acyltransferase [Acetobacteraceae bacterium]|nr:UDP-3-O-(3-hydroxymyristoyl)glucosamine N-acyltransferase [Acetobacteraceae bacterium]